jgi:exodeoxyribonuclease VII large subunit
MLEIYRLWRAFWRNSSSGSRHVDTFNNPAVTLDADGRSVYRLSGQSYLILA